jgi:hypothetical protein
VDGEHITYSQGDVRRWTSQATVPHPKRVKRDVEQVRQVSLGLVCSAA